MSGITAIDPIALVPRPLPSATSLPSAVSTSQLQATGGNADQPAVVVDLSAAATTSLHTASTALVLDPDQVDYAQSRATEVNGFAANAPRGKAADVAATAGRWNEGSNVVASLEPPPPSAEQPRPSARPSAVRHRRSTTRRTAESRSWILSAPKPPSPTPPKMALRPRPSVSVPSHSPTVDRPTRSRKTQWIDNRHQERAAMADVAARQPGRCAWRRHGGSPRFADPHIAHRAAKCVRRQAIGLDRRPSLARISRPLADAASSS